LQWNDLTWKIAEVQWDQMDFLSEEVVTPRAQNQQAVAVGGPHMQVPSMDKP
jgi:transcription factor E2F3